MAAHKDPEYEFKRDEKGRASIAIKRSAPKKASPKKAAPKKQEAPKEEPESE